MLLSGECREPPCAYHRRFAHGGRVRNCRRSAHGSCVPNACNKSFVFGNWHWLLACTAESVHCAQHSRLRQCLHSTILDFYPCTARNTDYCCELVLSGSVVCPFVLLPHLSVITYSSLFPDDDFLQKCAGNTPESKILHLMFKNLLEVISQIPLAGEATLSRTHTLSPIMPIAET